jgi:hypothetical protein
VQRACGRADSNDMSASIDAILSSALTSAQTRTEIGTATAVKAMNIADQQGQAAVALLEQAAAIGRNVATGQPGPGGVGGRVDTLA